MTAENKSRWIPDAPVAQLDRALPSEGRGRKFESCRVRHKSFRDIPIHPHTFE